MAIQCKMDHASTTGKLRQIVGLIIIPRMLSIGILMMKKMVAALQAEHSYLRTLVGQTYFEMHIFLPNTQSRAFM